MKSSQFRRPALMTLTVDRSRFSQPEEAHRTISDEGYLRRLMRLLGIRTWFWVLEFQSKSGGGWPHWHILIDLADLPGERVDLQRAWRLWRDKWHLGGLDLNVRKRFSDPSHAVFYVTKYLTKMPPAFPSWVLLRDRTIRFLAGCKALGSLTGEAPRARPEPPEDGEQLEIPFRSPRTVLIWRMAWCGMKAYVFTVAGYDGEPADALEWQYRGEIDATPEDVFELANMGVLTAHVAPVDIAEAELFAICGSSAGGVVAALARLPREMKVLGSREPLRVARAALLLDEHDAAWRRKVHHEQCAN